MEEFRPQEFIQEAKAKAAAMKRERELEIEAKKEEERNLVLDAIRDGAALGKSELDVKLEIWKPEEVEQLFEGLVKCEKVRGKRHKISW